MLRHVAAIACTTILSSLAGVSGCWQGTASDPAATPPVAAPPPPADARGVAAARSPRRCLPLVLNDTCTMPCSAATHDSDGTWRLEFWNHIPVRIDSRCDDRGCIEAFTAEVPMGGECIARVLDHGCHFDGSACVGSTQESNWPPR